LAPLPPLSGLHGASPMLALGFLGGDFTLLYLKEYRPKAERLFDHLPWVALIGPGLVLNKDGSFQKTLSFRGPDLASSTDASLVAIRAQLNNALRRLGSRWCLHIEALRAASQDYSAGEFPDPVSDLIDDERRVAFEAEERHFESRYFLTLTYLGSHQGLFAKRRLKARNANSNEWRFNAKSPDGLFRAATVGCVGPS